MARQMQLWLPLNVRKPGTKHKPRRGKRNAIPGYEYLETAGRRLDDLASRMVEDINRFRKRGLLRDARRAQSLDRALRMYLRVSANDASVIPTAPQTDHRANVIPNSAYVPEDGGSAPVGPSHVKATEFKRRKKAGPEGMDAGTATIAQYVEAAHCCIELEGRCTHITDAIEEVFNPWLWAHPDGDPDVAGMRDHYVPARARTNRDVTEVGVMGEVAEMILEGTLCEECGVEIPDNLERFGTSVPGFTVKCPACRAEEEQEREDAINRRGTYARTKG